MKIRTKNFLYTSGIIIFIVTIAFSLLYLLMPNYHQKKKEKEIKEEVKILIEEIENQPISKKSFKKIATESFYSGLTFILKDSNERILYPRALILPPEPIDINEFTDVQLIEEEIDNHTTTMESELQYLTYDRTFKGPQNEEYTLSVIYFLQPINEAQEVLLNIYPVVLLICCVLGTVGAYFYSYYSTKRITKISETTRRMTFSKKIIKNDIKGTDEISELSKDIHYLHDSLVALNEHLTQDLLIISNLENSKTEFMQMASHELKTPLTALSCIIEGMLYKIGPYEDRDKYLIVCQTLLKEQANLIKDILYISKLDKIMIKKNTKFLLNELIENELPKFEAFIIKQGYSLEINLEEIEIEANREEIQRVVSNLINNAMKYTKVGGRIGLSLTRDEIKIWNECDPLKPQELDRIFEAFYRPDFARDRKDGGTGLGLYIISQLLQKNQFVYEFLPTEDFKGMVFRILLKNK
ncbi:sensor histidine kinase [Carnobacterium maltaromaticum]|uniref:sensor histidine kinase n=1 Tax=Carnobacterium maltaromaticum TaxID=2751 RepID=UPI00026C846D|nr:HAMP domain-containing sensor histidine kinase [Carnobacterium maltaromaticum]